MSATSGLETGEALTLPDAATRLLTLAEAVTHFGGDKDTFLRRALAAGLKTTVVDRRGLFLVDDVDALIAGRGLDPQSTAEEEGAE